MRALVKTADGPGRVALLDVPEPALPPGHVLVDVHAVAVCGTDRTAIASGGGRVPRILGHEVAGTVAALGSAAATDLVVGDRVTMETDASRCGTCAYCRVGDHHRCPTRTGIGTTVDGGLADRIAMPADTLHRLPEGVSFAAGSLTEPLAVAVHAVVERSPSLAGEVVVVIGPGAIGLLSAQVARAVGATVVLVGRSRHAERLELARDLGVAHAVASDEVDVPALVRDLTGGYGAHSVFECSGSAEALSQAPALLREGGRVVMVAFCSGPLDVPAQLVVDREVELLGSRGKRPSSFRTALALVAAGQVQLEPVIGEVLPIEEWERGIELVGRGVKVVLQLRPDPGARPARGSGLPPRPR